MPQFVNTSIRKVNTLSRFQVHFAQQVVVRGRPFYSIKKGMGNWLG
jgi:hypothetical protein